MYCPTCGTPAAQGLKYCNRCGANLAPAVEARAARLGGLGWALPLAVALVTLAGLGALFVVGMEFAGRSSGLSTEAAVVMLAGFLAVFAVDYLLIRQLSRVIDLYHAAPREQLPPAAAAAPPQSARLEAPRESADLFTEQTTRTLDLSSRERDKT